MSRNKFIRKLVKHIALGMLMVSFVFSNLPFLVLSSTLDFVKESNVVDTFWDLDKNPNIVDNFLSVDEAIKKLAIPEVQAANETGMVVWGTGTNATPKYKAWNGTNFDGTASDTALANATIQYVVTKEAPTRDEFAHCTLASDGDVNCQIKAGAGAWAYGTGAPAGGNYVNLGTTNDAYRGYDISYEQTSGDLLFVYDDGTASNETLSYRTWNGTTWSTASTLTTTVNSAGNARWVKLVSKPGSDDIMLAILDSNSDILAVRWNGTSNTWVNEQSLTLTASVATSDPFDIAWEGSSGDALVAYGEGTITDFWTYNGSTWTAGSGSMNPALAVHQLELASAKNSDAIAMITIDSGADVNVDMWNGSDWTTLASITEDAAAELFSTTIKNNEVDVAYEEAGNRFLFIYIDANALGLDYFFFDLDDNGWKAGDGSTTITAVTSATAGPTNYDDDVEVIRLYVNPSDTAQIMAVGVGLTNTIAANLWNGSTWSTIADIGTTTAGASVDGFDPVYFAWNKPLVLNTLTIGVTAGSKIATRSSGDLDQYAHDTTCSAPASCAAFTLNVSQTSVTVTSIKVTETGSVAANSDLSDMVLFYDTDGNWSDAGAETQYNGTGASFDGTQAATASGSLALTPATTYYFYIRFDLASGTPTYPKGGQTVNFQIAADGDVVFTGTATATGAPVTLAGTTTVLPKIDSTTFGAGLADGGRSGESITISGKGFGVALAGSRASCAGAVDTGCVRFTVGGAATVADGSVTSWSNTSIAFTIAAGLASDGGTSGLEVVAGSQGTSPDITFFIYPNVTSLTVPTAVADAAREFDSGDSDGVITANGDHFGTAGTVTIIGSTATQQTTGTCTVTAYQATCVGLQVPTAISDSTYTGSIVLTRSSDSKTHTFSGFRVLPRIITNDPVSGIVGDIIQLKGNHFCESGTCPVSPNRSTAADNVKFGSTQALDSDFVAQTGGAGACNGTGVGWNHSEICVRVPSGTPTGSQPTQVTSNTSYTSNTKAFTRASTVPNDPDLTAPRQYKVDNSTSIAVGGVTSETTVNLRADMTVGVSSNLRLQIEVQPTGTPFTCTGTNAIGAGGCIAYASGAGALEGTVAGGGGCDACTVLNNARVTFTSLTDGTKHWQARVRNASTGEYNTNSWISYGGNPDPSGTDFQVDSTGPAISNILSSNVGTNSASTSWDTSIEASSTQVQYNKTGTFVDNCATNNDCTTLKDVPPPGVTSHSQDLTNLDSGTTYYFRVRSKDEAGNETISANSSFITTSVTQPGKSTKFHIIGQISVITGGATATSSFSVLAPETAPAVKSAFVEVSGISSAAGTNNFQVQVNSQAAKTYVIDSTGAKTSFRVIYEVTSTNLNLNDTPSANTLSINPSLDTNIVSAKIVVTYGYTP